MTTLTEFLTARLDEDEAAARAADAEAALAGVFGDSFMTHESEAVAEHVVRHDPARVLREVAAKRAIVELHDGMHECSTYRGPGDIDNCSWCIDAEDCSTIQALAAVYSDHPDYRTEWSTQ